MASQNSHYRWFVVGVFFFFMLLHQTDKLMIGSLQVQISEAFGLDDFRWGLVNSGALAVSTVLYPLWGYLYDRYARAKLLALASFIWGATTWLNAVVRTYTGFLLTRASTGIDDLSWNSGFHLLASWALRLHGIPVAYFACHSGMSHCVLGTNRDHVHKAPPCKSCIYQSKTLYTGVSSKFEGHTTHVQWFDYQRDNQLAQALENLSVPRLMAFEWQNLPLGSLCLPGLRWILRIHHLNDDENTRYLLREYILSAWNVAQKFSSFMDETKPRAVIVFNGQFFPEATARFINRYCDDFRIHC